MSITMKTLTAASFTLLLASCGEEQSAPAESNPAPAEPAERSETATAADPAPADSVEEPAALEDPAPTAEAPPIEYADWPENHVEYDISVVDPDRHGGFDVAHAVLKLGNPQTGQGHLHLLADGIDPEPEQACDLRLNRYHQRYPGFSLSLNDIAELPEPGPETRIPTRATSFDLQNGFALGYGDFSEHRDYVYDVALVDGDEEEAEIVIRISDPEGGSLRARARVLICPPA